VSRSAEKSVETAWSGAEEEDETDETDDNDEDEDEDDEAGTKDEEEALSETSFFPMYAVMGSTFQSSRTEKAHLRRL